MSLTKDALVDSVAYASAIAQKELDWIKQQAQSTILKIDNPPNFQIQVARGQLEKPIATTTLNVGDHIFAEHVVVMNSLAGPIIGLHFMKQQCGHRYYTWPHPFPAFDIACQNCIEPNEC